MASDAEKLQKIEQLKRIKAKIQKLRELQSQNKGDSLPSFGMPEVNIDQPQPAVSTSVDPNVSRETPNMMAANIQSLFNKKPLSKEEMDKKLVNDALQRIGLPLSFLRGAGLTDLPEFSKNASGENIMIPGNLPKKDRDAIKMALNEKKPISSSLAEFGGSIVPIGAGNKAVRSLKAVQMIKSKFVQNAIANGVVGGGYEAFQSLTNGEVPTAENIGKQAGYWIALGEAGRQVGNFGKAILTKADEAIGKYAQELTVGKEYPVIRRFLDVQRGRFKPPQSTQQEFGFVTEDAMPKPGQVQVAQDFKDYPDFKDVKQGVGGGTKDKTRLFQEIDGAKSLKKKAQMTDQVGPVEKHVKQYTEDVHLMREEWLGEKQLKLNEMAQTIGKSNKKAKAAEKVLRLIGDGDVEKPVEELLQNPQIAAITNDKNVVEFARQARVYFDGILNEVNLSYAQRGQSLIPKRQFYSPDQLKTESIWGQVWGKLKGKDALLSDPLPPDFIRPDRVFNPAELAKKNAIPLFRKEDNLFTLLEQYTNTSGRAIFNTSILQNAKAYAGQLEKMGYKNSADAIYNWAGESYGGVSAKLSSQRLGFPPFVTRAMGRVRQAYARGAFPLNFTWNAFIQTSSSAFTIGRTGVKNSLLGLTDMLTNPKVRELSSLSYASRVKSSAVGNVTRQDIGNIASGVKIKIPKMDKATDILNYFTNKMESGLTRWSYAAGLRKGAEEGLTGRALHDFASETAAKTQSMYNLEDVPGILRADLPKTGAPFQTFKFEAYNSLKEWAGKTGTPPGTFRERMAWLVRFTAAAEGFNLVSSQAIGRDPWGPSSFMPYYDVLVAPITNAFLGNDNSISQKRAQVTPVQIMSDFAQGIKDFIQYGDIKRFRRTAIRYVGLIGVPGGIQIARTVDGMEAIANEEVTGASGKRLFKVRGDSEKLRALISGPYGTEAGQEYIQKDKKGILELIEKARDNR